MSKDKTVTMKGYTRKYFFEEIERILNARPIESIQPVFLFLAKDGLLTLLAWTGNKAIGDIVNIIETPYGEDTHE